MDKVEADRNLLCGILAIQKGLIKPAALGAALRAWVVHKDKPLENILLARGVLSETAQTLLKESLGKLLDEHGNDPSSALASIGGIGSAEVDLDLAAGSELQAALAPLLVGGSPKEALEDTPDTLHRALKAEFAIPSVESGAATPSLPGGRATIFDSGRSDGLAEATQDAASGPSARGPAEAEETTGVFTPGMATEPVPSATIPMARATVPLHFGDSSGSRYRVLRRHARGGLGEVFVALDEELGREVALKEIQNRHADQQESRARFVLEAEVTGGLEHPGIVPVYGLGHYEDGRPYYAMRFIHGHSFKAAIRRFHDADSTELDPGLRVLGFRQLLSQFIAVCKTMAYAHSRGVLHRDIKPDNIMVGSFGETLVVDWGLAKTLDGQESALESPLGRLRPLSGSGRNETVIGSAIGTPQYMSPEQAAGRLNVLGPASDIYSLGATLYNLLTGQAPFVDPSYTAMLLRVQRGDFSHPCQVAPGVDPALEAICLKAMARHPNERYPSALALADDLEHWLADEPVSVFRDPLPKRMARWAKRHRTVVAAAAVLLITGVTALSIGTLLIRREQVRTERNFRMARDAVDQMLTELGEVELADVPQMEPVRKKMLAKALDFYAKFLAERGNDRSIRQETGRAYLRLADIQEMLGNYHASELAYGRSIGLLKGLVAGAPRESSYRRDLARAHHGLGVLLKKSNRFQESERAFQEAQRIRNQLVADTPAAADDRQAANDTLYQLGALRVRLPGKQGEADENYRKAVAEQEALVARDPQGRDSRRNLARYRNNLGILRKSTQPGAAEKEFREAIAILAELTEKSPTVAGLQWNLARSLSNLGAVFQSEQKGDEAEATYRKSLDRLRHLADDYPSVPDYQYELAVVYDNLGWALGSKLPEQAEGDFRKALEIEAKLVERFPERPDYRRQLAATRRNLGILRTMSNRPKEAEEAFRSAVGELDRLVTEYPKVPEYQSALGVAQDVLAALLSMGQKWGECRPLLEQAIRHQRTALELQPQNQDYRRFLKKDYEYLELTLRKLADHTASAKAAKDLAQLFPDDAEALRRAGRLLAQAAQLAAQDPQLPEPERVALSRSYGNLAIERLQAAIAKGFSAVEELQDPVYSSIRDREAFRKLQDDLQARTKVHVG